MVLYSAITPHDLYARPALRECWDKRSILVIHGAKDDRIRLSRIQSTVDSLTGLGFAITTRIYPQDDHFLFFAKREELMQDLLPWLKENKLLEKY